MNNYDLVVIGGGTAGCAAAYIAGKLGLKVLLLEKTGCLGGTMTSGLVIPAMKSSENQINTEFYENLIFEMKFLGGQISYQENPGWFNPELLKIALDNLMNKYNVEVLFNVTITGINLEGNCIKSLSFNKEILSTSNAKIYNDNILRGQKTLSVNIGTRYTVDSTANCEIGKILNCNFLENEKENQPFSLRFIMGGIDLKAFSEWLLEIDNDRDVTSVEYIEEDIHLSTACTWDTSREWALSPIFKDAVQQGVLNYNDCNYFQVFTIPGMPNSLAFNCPRIVDNDGQITIKNTSKALIEGRQSILRLSNFCKQYFPGFENSYISNISDMLGIRTSRRIKGKYIYTMDDIISGKKFENPVAVANYPIDVHSKEKDTSTLKMVQDYQIPIEALMSADIDNLFVAGRCISSDFMAQGAIRVQPTCFSMGEGVARYIYNQINCLK